MKLRYQSPTSIYPTYQTDIKTKIVQNE